METNSRTVNNINVVTGKTLKNPTATPRALVLAVTIGDGKTYGFFDDACGIAGAMSLVTANSGTAMTVQGAITEANVREFLKSYAVIVSRFNLNASVEGDLANDLQLIYANIDETVSGIDKVFSSLSVSNMQQNPDLLNVSQGFVWTNNCALKIAGTAGTIYTLTFAIRDIVAYADLDAYLANNPLFKTM